MAALEARGVLFVGPRVPVYTGMIVGENNRGEGLEVNPVKGKQLTNVRTQQKDGAIRLQPLRSFTLGGAMSYATVPDLVEVTPKGVCLRKEFWIQVSASARAVNDDVHHDVNSQGFL